MPVWSAPGATGSPKLGSHMQAEAAIPVAVPAAIPAAVAAEVTLQELQEALEEEVLTRQSLSRELEAIRTANQNFARSGSGHRGLSLPLADSLQDPEGLMVLTSPQSTP